MRMGFSHYLPSLPLLLRFELRQRAHLAFTGWNETNWCQILDDSGCVDQSIGLGATDFFQRIANFDEHRKPYAGGSKSKTVKQLAMGLDPQDCNT
jgi:hypothetical protein